jgi:benzaldehyde dehydrogenase (NAD)
MSTERIIVPESKYDALVAELKAAWDAVESKPARALFDRTLATRVRSLTSDAVGAGATALFPQEQQQEDALVTPTILGRVTPAMKVYADESFGPLSGIITVPDAGRDASAVIDEMVRIANDTEYGLSAAVWGRDTERAAGVARKIEAGAVHVNAPTPADPPTVPHGGWKSSGWGRFNGAEGLRSFTQVS